MSAIVIFICIYTAAVFGILHAWTVACLERLDKIDLQEKKTAEQIREAAIKKECKRIRKFLEADGETVNQQAVQVYLRRRERDKRRAAEVVAFEVIQ